MKQRCLSLFLIFFCIPAFVSGRTDEVSVLENSDAISPPSEGNFALPSPQQPGPLLSFGQNIIGKNQGQLMGDVLYSKPSSHSMSSSFLFGITNDSSLYFSVADQSDPVLQLEYAFYANGNKEYQDQATIVGAVTLPINDGAIGTNYYGSPSIFVGTTYNRTDVNWLRFVSPGALLTTSNHHYQAGSQYFYEAGVGRQLMSEPDHYIFFGLLELDGLYTEKDKLWGRSIPVTGGSVLALTPSLWFSSHKCIIQAGVGFPLAEHLNSGQAKTQYFFVGSLTWTLA